MDISFLTSRKFRRMLANILSIVVMLAMAFPVTGSVYAQEPAPFIRISTSNNYLRADNFAPSTTVTFTVYATPNPGENPLWSDSRMTDENGFAIIWPWEQPLDLVVGNYVVATDGANEKQLVLEPLTIDVFDPDTDLVAGTAPIWRSVWVVVGNDVVGYPAMKLVEANAGGEWAADFALEYNFTDDMWGSAELYDGDGDGTVYHKGPPPPPPSPWLVAFPENDAVQGWEWPEGSTVTLTIDNAPGSEWSGVANVTSWGDPRTYFQIEFGADYNLQVGDVVTLTDEFGTMRTHTVQDLAVTEVNGDTDTVSGTAYNGAVVQVWPHGTDYFIEATAEDGTWIADFGALGFHTIEETGGRSQIVIDGNATAVDWSVPPPPPSPWLTVRANDDRVEAFDWKLGTTLTLEIDDPSIEGAPDYSTIGVVTGPTPWGDPRNYLSFNLAGVFDIQPGFEVSVGDGTLTKTLSVTNLTITDIDLDGNVVYGQAADGMRVDIWPCDNVMCANRHVNAASSSSWAVDFDVPGTEPNEQTTFDIKGGIVIDSGQCDEDGDCTNFSVAIPNPRFTVFPEWEWFDGYDWPDGATVTITVAGKSGCDTSKVSWDGFFNGNFNNFDNGCNVEVGDVVTFTDDTTTRTHTVRNLAITAVNELSDTVSGASDPYETVYVWQHEPGPQIPFEANENGEWLADLNGVYDIRPGSGGRSEIRDETGNATAVDWNVPNPHFTIYPEQERIEAYDWPDGSTVIMTVAGKPECETTKESWGGFFDGNFVAGCDVVIGDTVTFTHGSTIRTHIVQNLVITEVNKDANTVAGTADVGALLDAWIHGVDGSWMQLTAENGAWLADFGSMGFDLQNSMGGRIQINDAMGNATAVDWYIANPRFTVFPEWEWFDGWDWPDGAIVTITVADKPECETTKESWGYFFNGNFGEGCNVETGDTVTFTDGTTTRTHTVENLAVTKVNHEDNIIKGIANAGAEIHVWPHATGQEQLVTANPQGRWNVDFTGIYDLMPGDDGRTEIRDVMGNATAVDWHIPRPRIVASITEDWFYLQEFSPNTTLDFTVYKAQYGKPIWKGTATTDGSGFAWIDAEGRWNLEPGNYLVVKDGSNSKDLVIEGFTFDVFNLSNGQLSGTAPSDRNVWVGIGWENDGWSMDVTTDETGAWFADFGQPVPSDYQWVAAQIFDADGDASELRPDRIVDLWVAAYTYDAGTWSEGGHNYHFEATWNGGSETTNEIFFNVSGEAQAYDGYVLLRPGAVRVAPDCAAVDAIRPDQPTRFLAGYVTDFPMTYSEALAYFDSLTASAVWDDGQIAELVRHEFIPYREDNWFDYVCTFTADVILDASQPDWVNSGITVSAGQSFTIEAFGLMNPCSDTYPNGGEICIFYTPVGGEWAVPYENEFGIFPGPELPFMALLGRIGDGQPFLVGEGGTFTAEQDGTLWFTPNDNLRTDNQGAYGVLVGFEP